MIYCEPLLFCFIAVPKTGTTSIEAFFSEFCYVNNIEFIKGTLKDVPHSNPNGKHASIQSIKSHYKLSKEIKTIGFVRNPWDKVVSWYLYLKTNKLSYHFIDKNISFEEFIHTAPSFVFTESCEFLATENKKMEINFIGRYENLETDFKLLCEFLDIEWAPLLKLNQSRKTSQTHYSAFYNKKTKEYVEKRFINDIKLFDYTFEEKN
jgi:hypothetical protein